MKCFLLPQKRFITSRSYEYQLRKHIASLTFGCTIKRQALRCLSLFSCHFQWSLYLGTRDLTTWRSYRSNLSHPGTPGLKPTLNSLYYFRSVPFFIRHYFILFKNTIMNSRTFTEKLCSLDSIKLNYNNISAGTDKPLITKWEWTKGWTSWTCWTHFKDKKLVCKLYKYASWNAYLHDFRDWHQCKYSFIQGQVA